MIVILPLILIGSYLISIWISLILAKLCLDQGIRSRIHRRRILRIGIPLFILFAILPVLAVILPNSPVMFTIQALGNIWIGFYVYFHSSLLFFLAVICVFRFLLKKKISSAAYRIALVIPLMLGVLLLIYGMDHAKRTVITRENVTISKSAGDTREMKLVLISDLHLSVNSDLATIRRMVEKINGEEADTVLIAGDIFTSSYGGLKNPEEYAQILSEMQSRYGVFAIYGNHDVEEALFAGFAISPVSEAFRTEQMEQFTRDCGFTMLCDETVTIGDDLLQIIGRVDEDKAGDGTALRMSAQEVLSSADQSKPILVLEHEPVEFSELKKIGADLVLCGHTNAGQIFPGNLLVGFFNENGYGYKNVEGMHTFVTSGIGFYGPPMRIGTNSEIMVITVCFEQ